LHRDAYYGELDVVKYLVEEKGADVKTADKDGDTPLHWAAENGELDVIVVYKMPVLDHALISF
jgi:ankyrin repeat protein